MKSLSRIGKRLSRKLLSTILALFMIFSMFSVTLQPSIEVEAAGDFALLRQTDSQWYGYYYGGGSLPGTGCGIFALVNCVGYLTGQTMDVPEVASWAHSINAYNVNGGDGTYRLVLYPKVEAKYGSTYGFTVDCGTDDNGWWDGVSSTTLKNHLLGGGVAVGHVYNHFIAIVGYDASTNKFHVYDSAPSSARGTNYNGGDVWLTPSGLSSGVMNVDWFCLLSATANNKLDGASPIYMGENFDAYIRQASTGNYLTDDNNNVICSTPVYNEYQRWHFVYNHDDGSYSIFSDVKQKWFDVPYGDYSDNASIWLCDYNGLHPQRFYLYFTRGHFFFRTVGSDKVLDVNAYTNNLELCGNDTGTTDVSFNARAFEILKFNNDYSNWFYNFGEEMSVYVRNNAFGKMMTASGNEVIFTDATFGEDQRWIMKRKADGSYEFVSASTGLNLDVLYGDIAVGTPVDLFAWNGLRPQAFFVLPNDSRPGCYYIKPVYTNTVCDVNASVLDLSLHELNTTSEAVIDAQSFEIIFDGIQNNTIQPAYLGDSFDGYLTGKASGRTLTDMGNQTLAAQETTYAENQKFHFEYDSVSKSYKITGYSGKCVDVTYTYYTDGSTLGLYDGNGWVAQKFRFYESGGYYYISPTYTNRLVDISNYDNSTVQLYGTELADYRAFTLTKAEAAPEPTETELVIKGESALRKDGTDLYNVHSGKTAQEILGQFDNQNISVYNAEGALVDSIATVGTGYTVKLSANGEVIDMLTVIIMGDVNGDGVVDSTDYLRIKGTFLGTFSLMDASSKSADVDGNGIIDTTDYLRVKGHFIGTYNLFE